MKNNFPVFFYHKILYLGWIILLFGMSHIDVSGQIANASCNEKSPWINGTYTNLTASGSATGICLGSATGAANLIDANLSNSASLSLTGLGCTGTFIVKDNDVVDTYPAGTFAGFEVSATGLLNASIASTGKHIISETEKNIINISLNRAVEFPEIIFCK